MAAIGGNRFEPQKTDTDKRKQVQQQVPSPKSWWRRFDACCRFTAAPRTMQDNPRAPKFLRIEVHFCLVFHLPTQILSPRRVNHLGKPATDRLYAYFNLQIARDRGARRRIHHDEESSSAHVRMRPERNNTRPNLLVHDDRKWRTVVRMRRRTAQQHHGNKYEGPDIQRQSS